MAEPSPERAPARPVRRGREPDRSWRERGQATAPEQGPERALERPEAGWTIPSRQAAAGEPASTAAPSAAGAAPASEEAAASSPWAARRAPPHRDGTRRGNLPSAAGPARALRAAEVAPTLAAGAGASVPAASPPRPAAASVAASSAGAASPAGGGTAGGSSRPPAGLAGWRDAPPSLRWSEPAAVGVPREGLRSPGRSTSRPASRSCRTSSPFPLLCDDPCRIAGYGSDVTAGTTGTPDPCRASRSRAARHRNTARKSAVSAGRAPAPRAAVRRPDPARGSAAWTRPA